MVDMGNTRYRITVDKVNTGYRIVIVKREYWIQDNG